MSTSDEPTPPEVPDGATTPEAPRMSRTEWIWLLALVLLVCSMIWLATSDVWDHMFSVEETETAPRTP